MSYFKTYPYDLPYYISGEYVYTTTIGDGSCLFHSILTACDKDYRTLLSQKKEKEAKRYVSNVRKEISKRYGTKAIWKDLGDGQIAFVPFQMLLNESIEILFNERRFRKYILDNKNSKIDVDDDQILDLTGYQDYVSKNQKRYTQIADTVEYELFVDNVLVNVYQNCSKISNCSEMILKQGTDFFEDLYTEIGIDDVEKWMTIFRDYLSEILHQCESQAYSNWLNNLEDCGSWANEFMFELISKYFDKDIYVLTKNNGVPYQRGCDTILKRDAVVVLWKDETHYESLGRLIKDKSGNKTVERIFKSADPFIKKIYGVLCEKQDLGPTRSPSSSESESSDSEESSE